MNIWKIACSHMTTQNRTWQLTPLSLDKRKSSIDEFCYKAWHKVIVEIHFMTLALSGGQGLFCTLHDVFKHPLPGFNDADSTATPILFWMISNGLPTIWHNGPLDSLKSSNGMWPSSVPLIVGHSMGSIFFTPLQ